MSVSQETRTSLKRDHDSFDLDEIDELADLEQPFSVPPEIATAYASQPKDFEAEKAETLMPTPPVSVGATKRDPSPARSSTGSLTDAADRTPSFRGESPMMGVEPTSSSCRPPVGDSPAPSAFTALNGTAPPPPKKTKLSFAERETKRIEKEFRDLERAAEKARREQELKAHAEEEKGRKDAEKARKEQERKAHAEEEKERKDADKARKEQERKAHAEEKRRKDAEKEAERKKKEAEREEKRLAQETEKAAKEEKKRKKEEEKQRAEEEKRKKERSQKTLSSFFSIPASSTARRNSLGDRRSESPAPANPSLLAASTASPATPTPSKTQKSSYDKIFSEFFIYPNVTLAPTNRFQKDQEATEALQRTLDSYIIGSRSPDAQRSFDATCLFHLSGHDNTIRGKRYKPVREVMAELSGKASRPIDLTTDSQNSQIKRTNELLRKVPMKFLKFQEDVRPPYRGTYTSRPVHGIAKLARNPMRRDLPDTNYDYDSEAEWIEDEDGEDLHSEGGDEEEMGEDVGDMEGFLDDENDETLNSKRLVLQGDIEPISTGMCWEDHRKRNTNVKLMPYRMEIIIDQSLKSLDPFSTQYWDPPPVPTAMNPPRQPLNALKTNSSSVNVLSASNKPVKPFFPTASSLQNLAPPQPRPSAQLLSSAQSSAANGKPKKLLSPEDLPAFKNEIQGSDLSKVGLIEVLKKRFPGRPGAAIKNTLEVIAKRVGVKEKDKRWVVIEDGGGIGSA